MAWGGDAGEDGDGQDIILPRIWAPKLMVRFLHLAQATRIRLALLLALVMITAWRAFVRMKNSPDKERKLYSLVVLSHELPTESRNATPSHHLGSNVPSRFFLVIHDA